MIKPMMNMDIQIVAIFITNANLAVLYLTLMDLRVIISTQVIIA